MMNIRTKTMMNMKTMTMVVPRQGMQLPVWGVALGAMLVCPRAFALMGEHAPGQAVSCSLWPAGLADVVNSTNPVYGYFLNADDYFFFSGGSAELNRFLAKCSSLEGTPVTVVLQSGPGKVAKFHEKKPSVVHDWKLSTVNRAEHRDEPGVQGRPGLGQYVLVVEVHVGGRIPLRDLKMPANVELKAGQAATADVSSYVLKQKAKDE
jgi:hypothetical protein